MDLYFKGKRVNIVFARYYNGNTAVILKTNKDRFVVTECPKIDLTSIIPSLCGFPRDGNYDATIKCLADAGILHRKSIEAIPSTSGFIYIHSLTQKGMRLRKEQEKISLHFIF